ncbi:MAG: aconitate hydratase, partial [Achromobacter sp.]|nr:aconitate hydratase [Achromobacter sp.]
MENTNALPSLASFTLDGARYTYPDLPGAYGAAYFRLPVVLRLLLENALRNMRDAERDAAVAALFGWLEHGTSEAEIAFQPGRVLMHDTTSTPALVDIAAMRDALAEAGADPGALNPVLPVDVSVDHSLAVEAYARPDAAKLNLDLELRRNAERYRFLRWASQALSNVRIHPPGTGIMHTLNLEQLATVVCRQEGADGIALHPDMMIGTDSHTPMINGIGVLGWGVGGLEAQTVMFGMPTLLRIPDVIGVRLTGALAPGVTATDLALTVTQRLRAIGVSGEFVEFFGPGAGTLSAGTRCVVANMAPEYGATTGYFPIDGETLAYLRQTGRPESHVALVGAYAERAGIALDPEAAPRYTREIEIALDRVRMHVAGPKRPQDLHPYGATRPLLQALGFTPRAGAGGLPRHPVAIAAITSCTNTSNPRNVVAAGLLAKKANALGLVRKPWVKTSFAPGSKVARLYLEEAGLLSELEQLGFGIVAYACTTCNGMSGALEPKIQQEIIDRDLYATAVLSGNRNFDGRIHPYAKQAFLASPPLVVAYAIAGTVRFDIEQDPLGTDANGNPITLKDLWPSDEEIDAIVAASVKPEQFRQVYIPMFDLGSVKEADSPLYDWRPMSTYIRRPPYWEGALAGERTLKGMLPLAILPDNITTDHLSPSNAILASSAAGEYLAKMGLPEEDFNSYATHRGDHLTAQRATFANPQLVNEMAVVDGAVKKGSLARVEPEGKVMRMWEAIETYMNRKQNLIIVAGADYGQGSSRDWAAKGVRLAGVEVIVAEGFERIHRTNLV